MLVDPDLSLIVPSGTNGSLWDAGIDLVETEVATGAQVAFATPGTGGPEGADLSGLVLRTPSHPPGDLVEGTGKFVEYCDRHNYRLNDRNFSIRYESNIPRQVGLAGSSAIIVATLRCLMEFYDVAVPLRVQPSLKVAS